MPLGGDQKQQKDVGPFFIFQKIRIVPKIYTDSVPIYVVG